MYAGVRTGATPPDSLQSLGYGAFVLVVLVPTVVALGLTERFA